jgi:hypothetical protein
MISQNSEKEGISVSSDLLYICSVKERFVIALIALYLIASTEFHQVLKLPLLVQHYTEHHDQVQDMTFWEFLVMHYETDVPHDDQDMSLPFKDCHHPLTAQSIAMPVQKISLAALTPVQTDRLPIFDHSGFHSSYLEEIFQPPKI